MPATLFDEGVCGVKWVSVFPTNPHKFAAPNVSGTIILSEIEKGFPFAIMDGTLVTALQTFPAKDQERYLKEVNDKAVQMFKSIGIKNSPIWI